MNIDPGSLPSIPLVVRQWIYLIFLVILVAFNAIDAFWKVGDPWWLEGALRAANVVGIFIASVAFVNARPSLAETVKKEEKKNGGAAIVPVVVTESIGHPENLQNRPVTESIHDQGFIQPDGDSEFDGDADTRSRYP